MDAFSADLKDFGNLARLSFAAQVIYGIVGWWFGEDDADER